MHRVLRLGLLAAAGLACAPKTPVTDWGYSSWISETGVGSSGAFERARETCLARSGVRDPATVEIGGATEREFIQCMNTAHWCTAAHPCN